jgi:hypothetical protein
VLLDSYYWLAECHLRTGRTKQAEQTFEQPVRPFVDRNWAKDTDAGLGVGCPDWLLRTCELLRESKPEALAVARQAAALAERLADSPPRDPAFREALAVLSVNASAMLSRLGDPKAALRQAEQARYLSAELCRTAPPCRDTARC